MMASCSTKHTEGNHYVNKKFQEIYERIKKERPWEIRPGSAVYTTAKEKYMIKLVSEGHDISEKTIAHVVGRCYEVHNLSDPYVCCHGYILTSDEYKLYHVRFEDESRAIGNINKELLCSNGALFYPVDMLSNPFGEWKPNEKCMSNENHEVYTMIKEKWQTQWFGDELHKYTLKHLIKQIDNGNVVSSKVKAHVVSGCESDLHRLDESYSCCYGFVLKNDKIRADDTGNLCWCSCLNVLNYSIKNPAYHSVSVAELRFTNYQTYQTVNENCVTSNTEVKRRVYDRIRHRDLVSPIIEKVKTTLTEQYLIEQMENYDDIPNEVISHALEECNTYCHLLTEKYACWGQYIVKSESVLQHDFINCTSDHEINNVLRCYNGRVFYKNHVFESKQRRQHVHVHDNEQFPQDRNYIGSFHKEDISSLSLNVVQLPTTMPKSSIRIRHHRSLTLNDVPLARPPPRPAPPPPDLLDELFLMNSNTMALICNKIKLMNSIMLTETMQMRRRLFRMQQQVNVDDTKQRRQQVHVHSDKQRRQLVHVHGNKQRRQQVHMHDQRRLHQKLISELI